MSEATVTAAVVGGDAWCARCGYNLRGLAEEGRCPECGMAVRESLERRGLEAASGRELRLARRGLWVMAGASAVGLLVSIGALLATFGTGWMMARMSTGSSASHLTVNMILWLIVGWVGIAVSGVNGLGMFWATTPGRRGGGVAGVVALAGAGADRAGASAWLDADGRV